MDVAYLQGGPDAAILVAVVGLRDGSAPGRHPLEDAAQALIEEGVSGAMLWIRLRRSVSTEAIRLRLIDGGLLRGRSGGGGLRRRHRTSAGDHILAGAQAAASTAAELVAAFGPDDALGREPSLADVLAEIHRPAGRQLRRHASTDFTPAAAVARGMRRKVWRRRRFGPGFDAPFHSSPYENYASAANQLGGGFWGGGGGLGGGD